MSSEKSSSRVPEGWREAPISELCDLIVDCVNKTAPVVEVETPFRMIRTTNVRDGKLRLSGARYVDEKTYELWTRRAKLQEGDVILTREAPIGEVAMVEQQANLFLGQRLMQYRANPETLDSKFLLYSFLSDKLQNQFTFHGDVGSTVSHIRVGDCLNFILNIPPLEEQRKIAAILSTWDETIEGQTRLLELKRERKRGLMQQLLTGRVRFKEFEGLEWQDLHLNDVVKINYGKSPKDIIDSNGNNPVYGTGGITGHTNESLYEGESIVLGRKGTISKVRFVTGKFWAIDTTYFLDSFKATLPKWIYYFLSGIDLTMFNEASGVPSLNRETLQAIPLTLPPLPEQQKIADVLSAADAELETLTAQLSALKEQKRGLMQRLLTGKTRVKVA